MGVTYTISPVLTFSCISGGGMLGMDVKEFSGATVQRVYQYLRRHATGQNLDIFSYCDGEVEGSERDFLEVVLRYVAHTHTAGAH